MSTNPCSTELKPMSDDARHTFRLLLKGTLILFALVAAVAAMTVILYQSQVWVEIVGKDLLRTNAPSETIASARDAVIRMHQNWVVGEDEKQGDPSYQGGARTWSVGSSSEETRMKVSRVKTRITDKDADNLSIESIAVTDTPTLVFIDYDDPTGKDVIVNELVSELVKRGVKVR